MINTPHFSSSGRSTYPGEFTPNPFIFEKINEQSSFNIKNAIFSNINISEDEAYYQIELDTPGLRREDFLVRINERGNLLVSGIHKEDSGFLNEEYKNPTNNYSGFSRELSLPNNVDTDFVRAQCRSGVLSIRFLKTKGAYPKRSSIVVVY
jgi:HSP20 family protein